MDVRQNKGRAISAHDAGDGGESGAERARLAAHDIRPRKRFGQNFLIDPRIPELIVERAHWAPNAPVLEIGAGGGALTHALLQSGRRVWAVEIDRDLAGLLALRFEREIENGQLVLTCLDALELETEMLERFVRGYAPIDPARTASKADETVDGSRASAIAGETVDASRASSIAGEAVGSMSRSASSSIESSAGATPHETLPLPECWVAGNLPYTVTTPLLLWTLRNSRLLAGAVFMVQREYADRLVAPPGSRTYGSITVFTRAHADAQGIIRVGRSSFWPRPGVESTVLELRFPKPPPFAGDSAALERVLRASFGQRRKMLANTLASGFGLTREDVAARLRATGIDPAMRAEQLGLAEFARLAESFAQDGVRTPKDVLEGEDGPERPGMLDEDARERMGARGPDGGEDRTAMRETEDAPEQEDTDQTGALDTGAYVDPSGDERKDRNGPKSKLHRRSGKRSRRDERNARNS